MKTFVGLAFLFSTLNAFSQSITFTTETSSTSENAMMNKILQQANSEIVTYTKADQYLSVMVVSGYTMTQLQKNDTLYIVNSKEKDCARISRSETLQDSLDNGVIISDVKVQKLDLTIKILGYSCKKAIIQYKANQGGTMGVSEVMSVWYTEEIQSWDSKQSGIQYMGHNPLEAAIRSLGGAVLKTESYSKSTGITTSVNVTGISTSDIPEEVFKLSPKQCKKYLNLKEYKALVKKRNQQAASQNAMMRNMNSYGGW